MPNNVENIINKDKKESQRIKKFIKNQRGPRQLKIGGLDARYTRSARRQDLVQQKNLVRNLDESEYWWSSVLGM